MNVTVLDLPRPRRTAHSAFKVELFDGGNFADAGWPTIADCRDLKMHIFQSREFLGVWANTIGRASGAKSYLLVVHDGAGEPVLYLPLMVETKFNVRFLRFMDSGVADYNAPILSSRHTLSQQEFGTIWTEALSLLPDFDVIDLKKISGEVAGAPNPLTHLCCTPHTEDGHALLFGNLDESSKGGGSISLQRKLDRELRKIGELGEIEFVVNPTGDLAGLITEKLFDLKRKKYGQTSVPDFLEAPGVAAFYREIADMKRGKIGHLSALFVGKTVVSAHLGYVGCGGFYYILPAYDAAYGRYRPGHLLLRELIHRATAEGAKSFDFGCGDEAYKDLWTNHRLPLFNHERAMTAAGHIYLQMRRVRRFVKNSSVRGWLRSTN